MYKSKGSQSVARGQHMVKLGRIAAALATAFAAAGSVQAFEIDTGNEDLVVRWDNTVRYTYGKRTDSQMPGILRAANNNDGDYNFNKWATVTNRLDILSEFDVVYKGRHGARVSAAGWYDYAYEDIDGNRKNPFPNSFAAGSGNPGTANPPTFQYSPYINRYYNGPSGEWLDAFLFTGFDIGDVAVNMKLGQHTVIWGEPLAVGGAIHGVSYSQSRLDLGKAQTNPGIEAKELFMPLGNFSASVQATNELVLAGQYFYDWQPTRVPEAGTYLGANDLLLLGASNAYFPLGAQTLLLPKFNNVTPEAHGDWGLAARWSPEWADATIGFYYRNFSDKLPGNYIDLRGLPPSFAGTGNAAQRGYGFAYGGDIDLFGISLAKQMFGISWGAELSYRQNMPLNSDAMIVATAAQIATAKSPAGAAFGALRGQIAAGQTFLPTSGDSATARGDTMHGLINALGTLSKGPLWDSASYSGELTWNTWTSVTERADLFKGRAGYTGIDKANKNALAITLGFTPTWYQVFPSVDLTLPMAYVRGLYGNSAVSLGGNEGAGNYSFGVGAVYQNKYIFDLRYIDNFGRTQENAGGTVTAGNGLNAYNQDRGWLVFNFKTTF